MKVSLFISLMLLGSCGLAFAQMPTRAAPGPAPMPTGRDTRLVDLGTNVFDRVCLLELGERTLGIKDFKWHHAESAHFVIHYENAIFAQKVMRMAEFFYDYISADLKVTNDLRKGRSHIFIFNSKKDWELFKTKYAKDAPQWSASFVYGAEMFLQQTGGGSDAADTLGHEMTHLIINRFFDGNPPLAINEGLAEWYGEFAYAAFKGVKKSKKQEFKRLNDALPLASVLTAEKYPAQDQVHRFYLTGKYFVGFLMIRKPAEMFAPFFADVTSGTPVQQALGAHYGLSGPADVEKEFAKFTR